MSRVELKPKNPDHEVIVGLDRPLDTFFILVLSPEPDDPNASHLPLEFKDRWLRSEVIEKIRQYAVDDDRTKEAVRAIFWDVDPAESVAEQLPSAG